MGLSPGLVCNEAFLESATPSVAARIFRVLRYTRSCFRGNREKIRVGQRVSGLTDRDRAGREFSHPLPILLGRLRAVEAELVQVQDAGAVVGVDGAVASSAPESR